MSNSLTYESLMGKALRYLSLRPRSQKEMVVYLHKKTKDEPNSQQILLRVIARLKEMGYIDDQKFASQWVSSRTSSKAKGVRVLAQELKIKGIAQDIVENVLQEFNNTQDEPSLARKALGKRVETLHKLPGVECRRKMSNFLLRRGFSYNSIRVLVDEYCLPAYNTEREIE